MYAQPVRRQPRHARLVDTTRMLKTPIGEGSIIVRSIRQIFFSLPTGYKLSLIIGIFVSITLFILILSNMALSILSAVRAYTTGDGQPLPTLSQPAPSERGGCHQ